MLGVTLALTLVVGLVALQPMAHGSTSTPTNRPPTTKPVSPATEPSPTTTGRFIVHCEPTVRSSSDPIIFAGRPERSHSHDFFGPHVVSEIATPASLTRKRGSCSTSADRSAYWFPTLRMNDRDIRPERAQAYYAVDDLTKPFPVALTYVTQAASVSDHVSWSCAGRAQDRPSADAQSCREGEYLYATVEFPGCWDGVHTGSIDHQSHMAYASTSKTCPPTHPVHVPQLTLYLQWSCNDLCGPTKGLALSSGPTRSLHADFVASWDAKSLKAIIAQCKNRDCGVLRGGATEALAASASAGKQ